MSKKIVVYLIIVISVIGVFGGVYVLNKKQDEKNKQTTSNLTSPEVAKEVKKDEKLVEQNKQKQETKQVISNNQSEKDKYIK